jgi:osmotically-inducible protein OsmY
MLEKLNEAIQKSFCIKHAKIKLDYKDGVVILSGKVDSYYQKQMAQEVVRSVNKKFSIKNDIFVQKRNCTSPSSYQIH